MPWMPFYSDEEDWRVILDWLNQQDEIAFVISDVPGRWRTVQTVSALYSPRIYLWHIPSGPLPLVHPLPGRQVDPIADPWSGWTALGSRKDTPYFGPYYPGVIRLNHRRRNSEQPNVIRLSSFEWTGDLHARSRCPAAPSTKKFWQSLRRWIRKSAVQIPRSGPIDGPRPQIWAFPAALSAIRNGCQRADNPD